MSLHPDRKKLIKDKMRSHEERETLATSDARSIVSELLQRKGYLPEDIEKDRVFTVRAGQKEDTASVDFIIRLRGKRYMAIKCSMALVSRERHVLAFSRAVDEDQIPYSVITDGLRANLMETSTGRVISEELDALPSRQEAMEEAARLRYGPCPPERKEKETRILLAFECARCQSPPSEPA
ncbi:MAG: type I restriction enzyme HsdR N-terminal domain-containing protein [Nitrospirota bacterium]|jgi:hypothetical protein